MILLSELPEGSIIVREGSDFLTVQADFKDTTILRTDWIYDQKLPILEFGIRASDLITKEKETISIKLIGKQKVTQLLDLLKISIRRFYSIMEENPQKIISIINEAFKNYDSYIYFKCHLFVNQRQEEGWYAHAITTERHVTVPYRLLEDKIKTRFKDHEVIREEFHLTPVWTVKLREWSQKNKEGKIIERFEAFIVVSGGKNIKEGRIHVIPKVKIGSCDNSIRAIENIEINHTEGWEVKFDRSLDEAHQLVTKMREVIRLSMNYYMDENMIRKMLNEVFSSLLISKESVQTIFFTVMERIANTHKEGRATVWDVTQAITYVGSHPDEAGVGNIVTEHARNQLQAMGYRFAEKVVS